MLTAHAHFMLYLILSIGVLILVLILLCMVRLLCWVVFLNCRNQFFGGGSCIKSCIHLCLHVAIEFILWWFRVCRHWDNSGTFPRRTRVLYLVFLLNLGFQGLTLFYLLAFGNVFINLSWSFEHFLIFGHFVNIDGWINHSVACFHRSLNFFSLLVDFQTSLLFLFCSQLLSLSRENSFLELRFLNVNVGIFSLHT